MSTEQKINLAGNLEYLIKENHFTISRLARKLDLAKSSLHNYTCGAYPRGLVALIKISQLFNVTLDQLVFSSSDIELMPNRQIQIPTSILTEGLYEIYVRPIKNHRDGLP